MKQHITLLDLPNARADAEGLRTIARIHRESVQRTHDAAAVVAESWLKLDEHVQAPFSSTFDQLIAPLATTAARFRTASITLSDAIDSFASELDVVLTLNADLRVSTEAFLKLVRTRTLEPGFEWDKDPSLRDQNDNLAARCMAIRERALAAEDDFCRKVDFIPPRSEITAGMRTDSEPGYGGAVALPQWRQKETAFDAVLSDAARSRLDAITQLTPEQLARWVATNEDLIHELVDSADPTMVAAWWAGVSAQPELASVLIATAPMLIGGLDGLPPAVRVAANVNVARDRLAENEAELATLNDQIKDAQQIALLREENAYLQRAIDGKSQLYLYDPDRDRIIEMFGDPATATSRMNWVPGTTASLEGFYNSFLTDLPKQIAEDANALVFVMKDGKFPQLNDLDVTPANAELMKELGSRVARFEAGMDAAGFANQHTVAVGHSAGIAIVSAAETAGAKVDVLFSLSGAGMSSEWVSNPDTIYYDMTPDVDAILPVRGTADAAGLLTDGWAGYPQIPGAETGFIQIDPEIGRDLDTFDFVEDIILAPGPGALIVEAVVNHNAIPSKETSDVVADAIGAALRERPVGGRRRDGS